MASETAAVKANFNSLLEAHIALSYQITYAENLNLVRCGEKPGAAATDGYGPGLYMVQL